MIRFHFYCTNEEKRDILNKRNKAKLKNKL